MKKKILTLVLIIVSVFLISCTNETKKLTIITPSGTPSILVARMMYEDSKSETTLRIHEIVNGSDPLVSAFTSKSHDIIFAPTNLGLSMYNNNQNYKLGSVVVWGNNYIISKVSENIIKPEDLEGKTITAFGKNQTPDIILLTILQHYNLLEKVSINYVQDVTTAQSLFIAGETDIILSAEPSLSRISKTMQVNRIDLQDEWEKVTGSTGYPQVGVFINQDTYVTKQNEIDEYLSKLEMELNYILENPRAYAKIAVQADDSFYKLGEDIIAESVLNSHYEYKVSSEVMTECNDYFKLLFDFNSKLIGGKIPDESFYKNSSK